MAGETSETKVDFSKRPCIFLPVTNSLSRRLAAVFGFLAVVLGAFGAHGLQAMLLQSGMTRFWEKAVLYHLVHSVVLLALSARARVPAGPVWLFVAGMLLFSGSLYIYAIWMPGWLMRLTPLGGLCFLAGWLWLVVARK